MTNEFADVDVHTGEVFPEQENKAIETVNPNVTMAPVAQNADQARQIAEVQTMMIIAKSSPRHETTIWKHMKRACERLGFAQNAKYAYKRGGTIVSGLGIKAIRELSAIFGNIDYGYRELEREGDVSWVEAFAWDMERNVRVVRKFPVKHWRDKRGGGEEVIAERDKYELVAGQAQRRVRSCLEQLLPADYIEKAEELVDKTMRNGDGRPLLDRIRDLQVLFDEMGVSTEHIEAYLQHPIKAIVPAQLPQLTQIYKSLRDGVMKPSEIFKDPVPKTTETTQSTTEPEKDKTPDNSKPEPKKPVEKAAKKTTSKPKIKEVPPNTKEKEPEPEPETDAGPRPKVDIDGEPDPFAD